MQQASKVHKFNLEEYEKQRKKASKKNCYATQ